MENKTTCYSNQFDQDKNISRDLFQSSRCLVAPRLRKRSSVGQTVLSILRMGPISCPHSEDEPILQKHIKLTLKKEAERNAKNLTQLSMFIFSNLLSTHHLKCFLFYSIKRQLILTFSHFDAIKSLRRPKNIDTQRSPML